MNKLRINFENCYGIRSLEYDFYFNDPRKINAYAVYAPNGLMKTSFSRTFEKISQGEMPCEERYQRPCNCAVLVDEGPINQDDIYVLKSEIDINSDSPAITNILVNPDYKARYDEMLVGLEKQKSKLLNYLNKISGVKKADLEQTILNDCQAINFSHCISELLGLPQQYEFEHFRYATIFDQKAIDVLTSPEFVSKANEFNERYQELFENSGSIYQKGVFNPAKADISFLTLDKQGFFAGGHRVHLKGEDTSIDKEQLEIKLQEIHARIDSDQTLKSLRISLAKNAQTQSLVELIENIPATEVELLLQKIKPANIPEFRKELWVHYIKNSSDAVEYVSLYGDSKDEISSIETEAAQIAPRWASAVERFNDRFVDMPFTLSVENQQQAALGREQAKLKFVFNDGVDEVKYSRGEIKNLSQGEKRALYLLNFIFDVEYRKQNNKKTLFIIDDVADSFDYKNKHAIIQYLEDLNQTTDFYQIILTHNFDFFRTLANNFVHRDRCLMANRNATSISLTKAEGIKNYFIGKWKDHIIDNECILCATIPFSRNLIEYTKGDNDPDYLKLTSLLHWKTDTGQITVADYYSIYNLTFNTNHPLTDNRFLKNILFDKADEISLRVEHDGLNLEDKVLLSIAIRLQAEIFLTNELRNLKNDINYWCQSKNQFGSLAKEFKINAPSRSENRIIEKVSITVSSNIHLNSFMYEPILDLTIEHLIRLYLEVKGMGQVAV